MADDHREITYTLRSDVGDPLTWPAWLITLVHMSVLREKETGTPPKYRPNHEDFYRMKKQV